MKPQKINDIIYIQLFDDDIDLREQHEVTWCNEQINETDIKYIRSDNLKDSNYKLRTLKNKLKKDAEFIVLASDLDNFYVNWNELKELIKGLMENNNA